MRQAHLNLGRDRGELWYLAACDLYTDGGHRWLSSAAKSSTEEIPTGGRDGGRLALSFTTGASNVPAKRHMKSTVGSTQSAVAKSIWKPPMAQPVAVVLQEASAHEETHLCPRPGRTAP